MTKITSCHGTKIAKEEDRFEKTADELEEVLKRKFPDVSPPKATSQKSQSVSKPTSNTTVPILPTSPAIKQEVKEEPGNLTKFLKRSFIQCC